MLQQPATAHSRQPDPPRDINTDVLLCSLLLRRPRPFLAAPHNAAELSRALYRTELLFYHATLAQRYNTIPIPNSTSPDDLTRLLPLHCLKALEENLAFYQDQLQRARSQLAEGRLLHLMEHLGRQGENNPEPAARPFPLNQLDPKVSMDYCAEQKRQFIDQTREEFQIGWRLQPAPTWEQLAGQPLTKQQIEALRQTAARVQPAKHQSAHFA